MPPSEFYIIPEDVYRLGNASEPKLAHVRQTDVQTIEVNGVVMVIANGKGVHAVKIGKHQVKRA